VSFTRRRESRNALLKKLDARLRGNDGKNSPTAHLVGLSDVVYFPARINTPSVTGELLKPVFSTSSAFTKPAFLSISRKSFPGIAPPSH
jgi:hypothetical protein